MLEIIQATQKQCVVKNFGDLKAGEAFTLIDSNTILIKLSSLAGYFIEFLPENNKISFNASSSCDNGALKSTTPVRPIDLRITLEIINKEAQ